MCTRKRDAAVPISGTMIPRLPGGALATGDACLTSVRPSSARRAPTPTEWNRRCLESCVASHVAVELKRSCLPGVPV